MLSLIYQRYSQLMIGCSFPYTLGTKIFLIFCEGALCTCSATLSTLGWEVYTSALVFTSCLNRALRSTRSGGWESSLVFSEHVQSPGHAYYPWNSQKYVLSFKTVKVLKLFAHFIPQHFLLSFLVSLLFLLTISHHLCHQWVKYVPENYSNTPM